MLRVCTFSTVKQKSFLVINLKTEIQTISNFTFNWNQCRGKRSGVPEVNAVNEFHASVNQAEKGKVYDKKPFKFLCEKGKTYMWCACGHSKTQVI